MEQMYSSRVIDPRYIQLLEKYCSNKEIIELLRLARIDSAEEMECYYLKTNKYPDNRDIAMKLQTNLEATYRRLNK